MGASPVLVLLAGGLARRMGGGHKGLLPLAGRPILAHIVARLAVPGRRIAINANGDPAPFAAFGLPVVPDTVAGFPGPLAGILAGMRWTAAHVPDARDIVTVPGDTPFIPRDLVERLIAGRDEADAEIACAASGSRTHPPVGLWPVGLADPLERAIREETARKVDLWAGGHRRAIVAFASDPTDPFFNVNRPDDIALAERLLRQGDAELDAGGETEQAGPRLA